MHSSILSTLRTLRILLLFFCVIEFYLCLLKLYHLVSLSYLFSFLADSEFSHIHVSHVTIFANHFLFLSFSLLQVSVTFSLYLFVVYYWSIMTHNVVMKMKYIELLFIFNLLLTWIYFGRQTEHMRASPSGSNYFCEELSSTRVQFMISPEMSWTDTASIVMHQPAGTVCRLVHILIIIY